MALLKELKGSFVGGQVSPELQNRIDLEKFNTFLKEAKNTQIKPEGGISNRAGTVFIGNSKDATFRLTINANVTATIIINGTPYENVTTKSVDLEVGSEYTYSVSAVGYDTKSGSGTVNENKVIDVELEVDTNNYTFTITNTQGATITINEVEQSSITAQAGTLIEWSVEKEGYISQSGSFNLSQTETKLVELVEDTSVTIKVTATPSDALIVVGEETISSGETATVEKNSSVTISVTKTNYIPYTTTITADENKDITIVLQLANIEIQDIKNPLVSKSSWDTSGDNLWDVARKTEVFNMTLYASGTYRIELGGGKGYPDTNGGNIIIERNCSAGETLKIFAVGGTYKYGTIRSVSGDWSTVSYISGDVWYGGGVAIKVDNGNFLACAGGGGSYKKYSGGQELILTGSGAKAGSDTYGSKPLSVKFAYGERCETGALSYNTSDVVANGDGQAYAITSSKKVYGGTSVLLNVIPTLISRNRHNGNAYARITYIG